MCEQWNEHRLLARAYQIIDREAQHPVAAAPPADDNGARLEGQLVPDVNDVQLEFQVAQIEQPYEEPRVPTEGLNFRLPQTPRGTLVARTIQELMENHECGHDRWKYVRGSHRCEECSHRLPEYIFECHQCRLQACNRCRRNRL